MALTLLIKPIGSKLWHCIPPQPSGPQSTQKAKSHPTIPRGSATLISLTSAHQSIHTATATMAIPHQPGLPSLFRSPCAKERLQPTCHVPGPYMLHLCVYICYSGISAQVRNNSNVLWRISLPFATLHHNLESNLMCSSLPLVRHHYKFGVWISVLDCMAPTSR